MAQTRAQKNAVKLAEEKRIAELLNSEKETKMTEVVTTVEVEARKVVIAEDAYNLTTDQITAALAEGFIRWAGGIPRGDKATVGTRTTAVTDVTISADKSPTKKAETQPYEKLEAISAEGMVLLSGGKLEPAVLRGDEKIDPRTAEDRIKGACDHYNYGLDLEVKRMLRKALENEISGPEKAIRKLAQAMVDLKMAKNFEQALVKARKQYEEELAEGGDQTEAEAE